MYKTHVETAAHHRGLITATVVDSGDGVEIYIRQSENSSITEEATIRISPEGFVDLLCPILKALRDEAADRQGAN